MVAEMIRKYLTKANPAVNSDQQPHDSPTPRLTSGCPMIGFADPALGWNLSFCLRLPEGRKHPPSDRLKALCSRNQNVGEISWKGSELSSGTLVTMELSCLEVAHQWKADRLVKKKPRPVRDAAGNRNAEFRPGG